MPMISCAAVTKRYSNGLPRPGRRRSRDRKGRDLRPARAQRRRQDHLDRGDLRHRVDDFGLGQRRRLRHRSRLSRRSIPHRPRAAGDCARHFRDASRRPCRTAAACSAGRQIRPSSSACCATFRCGRSGRAHRRTLGRHEAPGDDRQGAEPRARRFCSSTSRPRASTSICAATCGRWCAGCATTA